MSSVAYQQNPVEGLSPHLQDYLLDVIRSDVLGYRQQELVQQLPAFEPETRKEER